MSFSRFAHKAGAAPITTIGADYDTTLQELKREYSNDPGVLETLLRLDGDIRSNAHPVPIVVEGIMRLFGKKIEPMIVNAIRTARPFVRQVNTPEGIDWLSGNVSRILDWLLRV